VFDGAADMPELRVAIGMIVSLLGLAVALQAVATLPQELGDFGVADRVAPELRRRSGLGFAGPRGSY
jgi:hypothetical protein